VHFLLRLRMRMKHEVQWSLQQRKVTCQAANQIKTFSLPYLIFSFSSAPPNLSRCGTEPITHALINGALIKGISAHGSPTTTMTSRSIWLIIFLEQKLSPKPTKPLCFCEESNRKLASPASKSLRYHPTPSLSSLQHPS